MNQPLPVWPWPMSDVRTALLSFAEASLGLPYVIQPVQAVPGSPGRILCFGTVQPWLAPYAPILPENVDKVESIAAALRFCLEDSSARFDDAAWLSRAMGVPVTYSHSEDHTGKVVFA